MACLLPQFKCPQDTLSTHFKTNTNSIFKTRECQVSRGQCVMSMTTTTTAAMSTNMVVDLEGLQLPSLEPHSNSISPIGSLTYIGPVGLPKKDMLKLEKLHEEVAKRCEGQPTFAQWATAAGVDQKTLRKRLNYGMLCKDKMVKSNIRLVISIAKNYQGAGMNFQDLVQEGCRGLVKGTEKFDASKGFKFSTYAHWWIRQAVRKSLSDQSRTIRLPFHMVEATYRVREAKKQLYSENGRHPSNEEVAEVTGLSMKRLTAVLLTPKAPRSLDQKIGFMNLKPSEVTANPDTETAENLLMKQFMKQELEKVLDSLSPRENQVIRWRFGLKDGRMRTLQEIGELIGVSRERIRQIESCAFRKLKNKKRTKNLQQYLIS